MPRLQAGAATLVMQCLAEAGGAIVTHARLVEAVYGATPNRHARGNIQVAISRLRLRHPGAIETHHKLGYSLKPDSALARAAVRPIQDQETK
jgi:DNA-binding response OmpR family regulator